MVGEKKGRRMKGGGRKDRSVRLEEMIRYWEKGREREKRGRGPREGGERKGLREASGSSRFALRGERFNTG